MTQRSRKFAGIFLLLGSLIAYPAIASVVYEQFPKEMPTWLLLIYFAVAGMGWAVPAGMIIKWMARPDILDKG